MQMSWYEVMHELLHDEILSQEIDLCSLGAAHLACGWGAEHGQSNVVHGEAYGVDDGSFGKCKI